MKNAMKTAAVLAGGLLGSAAMAQDYTLKISSPTNNDVILEWMQIFEEGVEARSQGRIDVELYPANQLGQIPAAVEGTVFGTIEVTVSAVGFFSRYDARFEALDVPGTFESVEDAQAVLSDPDVMAHIGDYGAAQGLVPIAAFPHGPLALLTTSGVREVADISGQKIRVAGPTPLYIQPYERMGATPVSMPLGEVLPAMQNGAVDGLLAGVPALSTGKYYEVAQPLTVLPESYLTVMIVGSRIFLDTIGPELEAVVREEALSAVEEANSWNITAIDDAFALWEEKGGEVIRLSDEAAADYLANVEAIMPNVIAGNPGLTHELAAISAAASN